MAGHGFIINTSSYLPFSFTFNPEEVETTKEISYFEAPNVGGSHHQMFFTGFSNKKVRFDLLCIDMRDPLGVTKEITYFEQLREPDPGILGIAGSFFGNENYPPPQVLFNFGTGSLVPLMWNVVSVQIKASLFYSGQIRGRLGIPKRADINIELALDEDSLLFKANQIARKLKAIEASGLSIAKEVLKEMKDYRMENIPIYPLMPGNL